MSGSELVRVPTILLAIISSYYACSYDLFLIAIVTCRFTLNKIEGEGSRDQNVNKSQPNIFFRQNKRLFGVGTVRFFIYLLYFQMKN